MKYPKIETLYNRNPQTFKVILYDYRLPEFCLIKHWLITEKIDGTNIRVTLEPDGQVRFGGRTDNAQIPTFLLAMLQDTFPPAKLQAAFECDGNGWPLVILYGEGYGVKIQNGGKYREEGTSFRLFDVYVDGWWLNWGSVEDVAQKLGIQTVPVLIRRCGWPGITDADMQSMFFSEKLGVCEFSSVVALQDKDQQGVSPEGIVARTDPLLFTRRGSRVMWKLKFKDF